MVDSPKIVTLLLKSGANVTIKNNTHAMAIHLAAELTNLEVMKVKAASRGVNFAFMIHAFTFTNIIIKYLSESYY